MISLIYVRYGKYFYRKWRNKKFFSRLFSFNLYLPFISTFRINNCLKTFYLHRLKLPQEPFLTFVHAISVRPKLRKVERRLVPVLEMLSIDELMETNTYQKFNKLIESVFETIEDEIIITDEMGKSRIWSVF